MAQTVVLVHVFKEADYCVVYWPKNKYTPYVACWRARIEIGEEECRDPEEWQEGDKLLMYWAQGHYFSNENEALVFAARKQVEAMERRLEQTKLKLDEFERKFVVKE